MKRQRKKRNRKRNRPSKLFFGRLEPRHLLAGDVLGPHQAAGEIPTGANLIVNGDFETVTAGTGNFYANAAVPGWNAINTLTGQDINIFDYDADYENVLDLDSRSFVFDQIFQDVDTEAGTEYLVAFDFSIHPTEDPNATENTHAFQVFWDGDLVGTYTGSETWQTGVISVQGSASDTTRLSFAEFVEGDTGGGDSRGALLDNVRVVQATEQEIVNGSFEINSDDSDLFYRAYQVDGFGSAGSDDVNERLIQIVEEDEDSPVEATDGTHYLNLDATESTRDIVFTDIETTAGTTYYVTFDLRTDGDPATDADELRVRWEVPSTAAGDDSGWASTIRGNSEWQQYGLALTATADEMRLFFLEPGSHNGDGSGPLIDNLRVFEITTDSIVDEPVVDEPVEDEPVVDQPVVDQPVVDQPVVDQPVEISQS